MATQSVNFSSNLFHDEEDDPLPAIINSQDEEFEKYTMDNDNLHRHAYYGQEAPIESREGAGVVLEGSKLSDDNLRGFALMISKLLFRLAQI